MNGDEGLTLAQWLVIAGFAATVAVVAIFGERIASALSNARRKAREYERGAG